MEKTDYQNQLQEERLHFFEVHGPQPCGRVPPLGGGVTVRTARSASSAALVVTRRDVPHEHSTVSVECWVRPSYRAPARPHSRRIDVREHAG